MTHRAACATDKGRERTINEDSILCRKEEGLFAVADGVGGHKSGELASRMAIEYIDAYSRRNPILTVSDESALKQYFEDCLLGINQMILRQSGGGNKTAGMATTIVLAYVNDEKAYVVNVGDSRAYLIRDGQLKQITEDHTYVNELVKQGSITKEEAVHHPERNMITRALGSEEKLLPDYYALPIKSEDRILLCSDGLYNEVSAEELCMIGSSTSTSDEIVKELVHKANLYGGRDNISIVCIEIKQKKENANE